MSSEQIGSMKDEKKAMHGKKLLQWRVEESASDEAMIEFWKKLRHFYRTGEKPGLLSGNAKAGMKDLFPLGAEVFNPEDNPYPYQADKEEDTIVEPGSEALFKTLDHLLNEHQKENRKKFKTRLSDLVGGLKELLRLDVKTPMGDKLRETYDFAAEMIAFDKMAEMIPRKSSEDFPEQRLTRIRKVIDDLQNGLNHYFDRVAGIVIQKELAKHLLEENLFYHTEIIEGHENALEQTDELFQEEIKAFTKLIRAYRIAELEIEGSYQEEIHDEYFEHFTWHRLVEEELDLFHPIILVADYEYVIRHLGSLSKLLSLNQPINILILNHQQISSPDENVSWEDASHRFRQELAALTFSHRNTYTFQSSMQDPGFWIDGIRNCLEMVGPGLCHISVPDPESVNPLLASWASAAGRYFPSFNYMPNQQRDGTGRIDLNGNIQAEVKWPKFTLKAMTEDKREKAIGLAYTYADYKSLFPEKLKELLHVPSAYDSELLVPLNKYLELDEKHIYGKIPFIWLTDDKGVLQKAAVPNVWVVSCQERLDYWNFLQQLAGIGTEKKETTGIDKAELDKSLELEKNRLKEENDARIAKIEEEALARAAEKLIAGLLEEDEEDPENPSSKSTSDQ